MLFRSQHHARTHTHRAITPAALELFGDAAVANFSNQQPTHRRSLLTAADAHGHAARPRGQSIDLASSANRKQHQHEAAAHASSSHVRACFRGCKHLFDCQNCSQSNNCFIKRTICFPSSTRVTIMPMQTLLKQPPLLVPTCSNQHLSFIWAPL